MLSVEVTDINRNRLKIGAPISIVMDKEEDVPADSVVIKLARVNMPELTFVEVYRRGELIFSGEIDEQTEVFGKNSYTELMARNSAAKLIDNEAYPMSFVNPSAQDIFDFYARPFGFNELIGENKAFDGKFTVNKGISCYTAIRRFAMEMYGAFPKCDGDKLYIEGFKSDEMIKLGSPDVHVTDMRVVNLRCNRVSRVYLKHKEGEGYSSFLSDVNAEKDGIKKVRYINLASNGSTLKDADVIFDEAKKKSFYADVVCRGFYGDALGKTACLDTLETKYYVCAVRYVADKSGELTKLRILKKEG
ncbi:MAG: hypothetical protein IJW04_04595 [Ruminococcus sp.]|nr:hypothetical protein [Ruminococcus sp.]